MRVSWTSRKEDTGLFVCRRKPFLLRNATNIAWHQNKEKISVAVEIPQLTSTYGSWPQQRFYAHVPRKSQFPTAPPHVTDLAKNPQLPKIGNHGFPDKTPFLHHFGDISGPNSDIDPRKVGGKFLRRWICPNLKYQKTNGGNIRVNSTRIWLNAWLTNAMIQGVCVYHLRFKSQNPKIPA